jgi:hypothetical protein
VEFVGIGGEATGGQDFEGTLAKDVTAGEQEQMPLGSTPATDANWLMKHPLFKGNQFLQRVVAPASESESLESEESLAQRETVQRQEESKETGTPHSLPVQAKLTIGEPGDKYEQEADRVAADVVQRINAPESKAAGEGAVQRQEMGEDEEVRLKSQEGTLQRVEISQLNLKSESENPSEASAELEESIQRARGSGQPLADSVREPMEREFGEDFRGVRVHTDATSDELNQSIQAKAFTTGQDVFFRSGAYDSGSRGGHELLAHELTHVVQQSGGAVMRSLLNSPQQSSVRPVLAKLTIGEPGDKYEQEADRVASQVVEQINSPEAAKSSLGQSVQRQEGKTKELQSQPSISYLQRSPKTQQEPSVVSFIKEEVQIESENIYLVYYDNKEKFMGYIYKGKYYGTLYQLQTMFPTLKIPEKYKPEALQANIARNSLHTNNNNNNNEESQPSKNLEIKDSQIDTDPSTTMPIEEEEKAEKTETKPKEAPEGKRGKEEEEDAEKTGKEEKDLLTAFGAQHKEAAERIADSEILKEWVKKAQKEGVEMGDWKTGKHPEAQKAYTNAKRIFIPPNEKETSALHSFLFEIQNALSSKRFIKLEVSVLNLKGNNNEYEINTPQEFAKAVANIEAENVLKLAEIWNRALHAGLTPKTEEKALFYPNGLKQELTEEDKKRWKQSLQTKHRYSVVGNENKEKEMHVEDYYAQQYEEIKATRLPVKPKALRRILGKS